MTSEQKTQIIIAVIGLIGVIAGAVFANWDKIFQEEPTAQKPPANQDWCDKPLDMRPLDCPIE